MTSSPAWLEGNLSPEQLRPFHRTTRNANILAGAGSGKTRTLVYLLVNDLINGIPPNHIVAFTFTEKAADGLLARVYELARHNLPTLNLGGMYVGTIHSWCLQYLLEQSGFYNFEALDELHLDALVSRLYDYLRLEEVYRQAYPRAIGKFLGDLELFYNEHLDLGAVPLELRSSIELFVQVLNDNRLMTFGGMIRNAVEHLIAQGPIATLERLYVDEYQDVNPAQVELIKRMVPSGGSTIVVGDDLQSIYNWRGSDVRRILSFATEFDDASVFRLESNFRARPQIVKLGNTVAEHITLRDPDKQMNEVRPDAPADIVQWLSLDGERAQAEAVAAIVERFGQEGVPWNKIAVLLRSVVHSGRPIVDELEKRDIPVECPTLSRGGGFVETFLIPIFDWLRHEPHEPRNEIEERAAEQAANRMWEIAVRWFPDGKGAEPYFWRGLNLWADDIQAEKDIAYDVRGRLYDFLDYCGVHIAPDNRSLMVGLGIGSQIIRSVEEIHRRRISGHDRRTPRGLVSEVYHALLRNQQTFGESVPVDSAAFGVLVTTIHQAKGLEWPVVILPSLMRRRFPVSNRRHDTSFPNEIASRYGTALEDEHRLFYVAVTRAKERLFLLDFSCDDPKERSVFLEELEASVHIFPKGNLNEISSDIWRISDEDLHEVAPLPVRVGLSDLLLYVECPYQFGLRRQVAIQPSVSDELGYGRGLHELIQRRFENNEAWSDAERTEQTAMHVHLPYMSAAGEQESRLAIKNRLRTLEGLGVFEGRLEAEVAVDLALENGVVSGVIDGIQRLDNDQVLIRDWKTNIHDQLLPRYERQLQFYAHALETVGEKVQGAELVDVGASVSERRLVVRQVDTQIAQREQLFSQLESALCGIVSNQFPAKPSPSSCDSCDMYLLCAERYTIDQAKHT